MSKYCFSKIKSIDFRQYKGRNFSPPKKLISKESLRDVEYKRIFYAQKLQRLPTAAELAFMHILKSYHLLYEFQKLIKRWIVDFYLPVYNLVIEIDGDYHKNKQVILKDLRRDSWLWRNGFKIIRIENKDVSDIHLLYQKLKAIDEQELAQKIAPAVTKLPKTNTFRPIELSIPFISSREN